MCDLLALRDMFGVTTLGDIITSVNGKKVKAEKDLFAALDSLRVGDAVEVGLAKVGGASRTVRITLADRDRLQSYE